MSRVDLTVINNTILHTSLVLASLLALSILAKADFGTSAYAQHSDYLSPKKHLEEGIKAVKNGDNQGALMHLNEANKGLASSSSSSDHTAKTHVDAGIKALKAKDNQGALMHLDAADKAATDNGPTPYNPNTNLNIPGGENHSTFKPGPKPIPIEPPGP